MSARHTAAGQAPHTSHRDAPISSAPASRLSATQEHLLHLAADTRADVFSVEARLRIDGALDVERLRLALADVTAANDILRSNYACNGASDRLVRHVHETSRPAMEARDLSALRPAEQAQRVDEIAGELRARLADPRSKSTWHAYLVSMSPTDHVLLIALPALCADASTVEILIERIAQAYEQRAQGSGDLPVTPFDQTLESLRSSEWSTQGARRVHERRLNWWRERLAAAPRIVRLPFDTPFPDSDRFSPERVSVTLDEETRARFLKHSRRARVSAHAVLLATWRVLLWRLAGRSNVIIGTSCDGRHFGEAQNALGPIERFIPFELPLQSSFTFADVVGMTARRLEECRQAQRDFTWDCEEDQDEEDSAPAYFPLTFEYRPKTRVAHAGAIAFSIERSSTCIDRFDLGLLCECDGEELTTTLRYDAERMERCEVEPLLENLHVLMASALKNPERTIGSLDILSDAQRSRILRDFNNTDCPAPTGIHILERIEQQAQRTPAAPAVIFQESELTYGQLDARANQLARFLHRHGVGPNVFVAIHAEPSFEMIIAIIGIMKAGGAYVPLDPENPRDRLSFVLEDTCAPVLLTLERLPILPTPSGVRVLRMDLDWDEVAVESDAPLPPQSGPNDLAYSIYTSGSTGNPKGVRVTHANLLHSTCARTHYYGGTVDRYLLLSSFAFDSSVAGIFWTLIDGGALVLPEAGTQRDPRRIGALMARHDVSHSLCLASHYALVLSQAQPEAFASLQTAIVSGEVFSTALVDRHDERAPQARLFNEYGPTEGSVWSTVFDCHSPFPAHQVPIGRPIANTQIYVLDPEMRPVPVGVPGEMYQGGAGVTLGYLNRPDLTAAAFVPDPYSQEARARLYRTGDLVRYLSDGNIEFLGRRDHQVKLRGYRIELGEIEAVLGMSEDLREVAVICREDEPGERYLAAYFVCHPGRTATVPALRARLTDKLPAYMIPSAFERMDSLPRTNIGKLDTAKLPHPTNDRRGLTTEYVAPRTPLEEVVTYIWRDVLDRESIGIEDDYFELGGHSLLAVRIVAQLRDSLALEIPLRAIFDEPTIAGIARVIARDTDARARAERAAALFLEVANMPDDPRDAGSASANEQRKERLTP